MDAFCWQKTYIYLSHHGIVLLQLDSLLGQPIHVGSQNLLIVIANVIPPFWSAKTISSPYFNFVSKYHNFLPQSSARIIIMCGLSALSLGTWGKAMRFLQHVAKTRRDANKTVKFPILKMRPVSEGVIEPPPTNIVQCPLCLICCWLSGAP